MRSTPTTKTAVLRQLRAEIASHLPALAERIFISQSGEPSNGFRDHESIVIRIESGQFNYSQQAGQRPGLASYIATVEVIIWARASTDPNGDDSGLLLDDCGVFEIQRGILRVRDSVLRADNSETSLLSEGIKLLSDETDGRKQPGSIFGESEYTSRSDGSLSTSLELQFLIDLESPLHDSLNSGD